MDTNYDSIDEMTKGKFIYISNPWLCWVVLDAATGMLETLKIKNKLMLASSNYLDEQHKLANAKDDSYRRTLTYLLKNEDRCYALRSEVTKDIIKTLLTKISDL